MKMLHLTSVYLLSHLWHRLVPHPFQPKILNWKSYESLLGFAFRLCEYASCTIETSASTGVLNAGIPPKASVA